MIRFYSGRPTGRLCTCDSRDEVEQACAALNRAAIHITTKDLTLFVPVRAHRRAETLLRKLTLRRLTR